MAYAALVSLAIVLEQILDHDQDCTFLREKEHIKSLHKNIIFLSSFLEDFPGEAGNLEARITIAANEAEDVIEYQILNEIGAEYGMHHDWQTLYKGLENSIKEIDSVLEQAMQTKSNSKSKDLMSPHSFGSFSSRVAPNGKGTVVGFEEDLMKIKDRLCGEPSKKLQIIPIVGMGGIGKTTLARYAHDDPSTAHHFDIRVWLTISQNFSMKEILLGLLNSIDASKREGYRTMSNELLVQHGYKYLKGRRYLIVMDDMWNTNVWDDVRRTFPEDFKGSRIIITTRELEVASYVDSSSHPHAMHLMDVDQSWNLLRHKVFAQENCPPQLEKIGKLIARNCRGLPLAIVVIAGVLSKVIQMQDIWINMAKNVIEAVTTSDDGQFSEILSLSYTHLPHHLRPCFLYMGGFPEDYEINVSKLIKLWAAEGFLKSNGSKDLEEVAEEYLEDLTKRSLVLIHKKRSNGRIKVVKIHDLLRDLCIRKARDEKFFHVINELSQRFPEGIQNSRRLSIFPNIFGDFRNIDGSPIHTIILFRHWAFYSWKSFRLLRILDAWSTVLRSYPLEIVELVHLRYLAFAIRPLRKIAIFDIPGSLSKLLNLQTFMMRVSPGLVHYTSYLPIEIWRMPQLRHLILLDGFLPDPSTETCGQILALENLHTLTQMKSFTCSERILKMIPNLKKLGIIYSFRDIYETEWSKYGLNNLIHLHKLEKLNFYADPRDYSKSNLSQNLAFPVTLKKLTLNGSGIPWEDMSIVGSLPNLEVLKLKRHACHGFQWETTEGEFCQLKVLLIDRTDPSHWITESSHFPRLERLLLYNCHMLSEIPYSIGEIPTLQLIEVDLNNSSIVESAKRIQEEQYSYGNDLQVDLKISSKW